MILGGKKASLVLFVGDIVVFALSLWATLFVRYFAVPSFDLLAGYWPFLVLFVLWALVFYMSGLYGKRIVFFKSSLADAILKTQFVNIVLAALVFFTLPFAIAPKTILALYLLVSLALIYLWRLVLYPILSARAVRTRALIIAEGSEAEELIVEVNANPRYGIEFRLRYTPNALPAPATFLEELRSEKVGVLVVDTDQIAAKELLPLIYQLAHVERQYQFVEFENLYEEVFDRVPLSRLRHEWFLRNVHPASSLFYTVAKRVIDLAGGTLMGLVTLVLTPLVWIAMRLEGPGPLFIKQERIGERGKPVAAYKFRSMTKNVAASGEWATEGENRVTRLGEFLRKTSLDEFPQFLNILAGDVSLVGPRNDIKGLGERLAEALPYYNARYLVRPGITGWAQINQQYEPGKISPQSIEETKTRLAYDFYYLKNRSLGLDIVIALKTIKRMFFRVTNW